MVAKVPMNGMFTGLLGNPDKWLSLRSRSSWLSTSISTGPRIRRNALTSARRCTACQCVSVSSAWALINGHTRRCKPPMMPQFLARHFDFQPQMPFSQSSANAPLALNPEFFANVCMASCATLCGCKNRCRQTASLDAAHKAPLGL